MAPEVVIRGTRALLEQAKAKRETNVAELERIEARRAEHIHAIALLDSDIAGMESWLEKETTSVLPQPIAPEELHTRADRAIRGGRLGKE